MSERPVDSLQERLARVTLMLSEAVDLLKDTITEVKKEGGDDGRRPTPDRPN